MPSALYFCLLLHSENLSEKPLMKMFFGNLNEPVFQKWKLFYSGDRIIEAGEKASSGRSC